MASLIPCRCLQHFLILLGIIPTPNPTLPQDTKLSQTKQGNVWGVIQKGTNFNIVCEQLFVLQAWPCILLVFLLVYLLDFSSLKKTIFSLKHEFLLFFSPQILLFSWFFFFGGGWHLIMLSDQWVIPAKARLTHCSVSQVSRSLCLTKQVSFKSDNVFLLGSPSCGH